MPVTWDSILDKYVRNLISPDGRNTFESTPVLVEKILQTASVTNSDIVIDIGCGWGNLTQRCSLQSMRTIGIEPNIENLKEAEKRSAGYDVHYVQGSFEYLNYDSKVDVVISSLVFHQVRQRYKVQALKNVKNILKNSGRFILCDTMIMFDAEKDSQQFNEVYRYLLEKTTPPDVYNKSIAPYLQSEHIYTWNDMKRYTPKDNWFYSLNDMQDWLTKCELYIVDKVSLCPFLGILTIANLGKET